MKPKVISLILLLFLSSGCTLIGVGATSALGGTYYITGEIKASYPVSLEHLYKVVLYTFEMEKVRVSSVESDKKSIDIKAILSDNKQMKVHLYYNKDAQATIGIRIGVFGDEKRTREMLKKIQSYI